MGWFSSNLVARRYPKLTALNVHIFTIIYILVLILHIEPKPRLAHTKRNQI